jgi:hypothetical protein
MECTRAFSNIRQATKILSCALLASCVSFSVASAEDNSGALLLGVASNGDLLVSNSGSESASSIQNLEIAASQGIRGRAVFVASAAAVFVASAAAVFVASAAAASAPMKMLPPKASAVAESELAMAHP